MSKQQGPLCFPSETTLSKQPGVLFQRRLGACTQHAVDNINSEATELECNVISRSKGVTTREIVGTCLVGETETAARRELTLRIPHLVKRTKRSMARSTAKNVPLDRASGFLSSEQHSRKAVS